MAPPPPTTVRPKSVQRRPLYSDPVHHAAVLLARFLPDDFDDQLLFADAIRDGHRLCLLLNILRPASRPIPNRSPSQNISSFLATCSSLGVPKRFLFSQQDFLNLSSDPHALITVASSLINIVEFLRSHPKQPMNTSRISSRAAASTPNLLRDRPLPSTPQKDHYDHLDEQDEDDSDSELYLLSTQSTPQTPPLPKPPPKSPLRKSPTSSRIPSKQLPNSSSGIFSWSRPVSNLRASMSASGSGSSVNLPSLVSGLGSAAVSAASKVTLRKTPTKSPTPTKTISFQPTPKTPSTPTKIKATTQSPLTSRTKTLSPPPPLSLQDPRRSKSPPTPPSPTPRSPSSPKSPTPAKSPSSPRSPTRIRSPTSESPSRLRTSGMNNQAHQVHHQHHQSLTGVTPSPHHPSHPNHTTPLTHTKSIQSIQSMTSALSEGTTVISAKSSLFDLGRGPNGMQRRASGGLNGNYGTIRTVTTELTEPAVWDEEDSMKPDDFDEVIGMEDVGEDEGRDCWVEEVKVKLKVRESFKFPPLPVVANGNGKQKQDLGRVNEVEEDESASGCERRGREREREKEKEKERERQKSPVNVYLGKGKFPDDFMDVFGRVAEVRRSVERERKEEEKQMPPEKDLPTTPTPLREKATSPIPIQPSTRTRRTLTPIARSPPRSPVPMARSPTRSPVPPPASGSRALSPSPSPKAIGIAPSPSSPRKLAIVGFTGGDTGGSGSSESPAGTGTLSTTPNTTNAFPRRPTHWSRRSLDVPMRSSESPSSRGGESALGSSSGSPSPSPGGLLPRQKKQMKEASPDTRVPRRHSTSATRKPLMGIGVASASPTGSASGSGSGGSGGVKGSVPFPRTVSGESQGGGRGLSPPPALQKIVIPGRGTPSPTTDPLSDGIGVGGGLMAERTKMVRERYQSNIEGTAVRRRRPSSYDEVGLSAAIERGGPQQQGGRPRLRSRFESMVNLSGGGGGLSNSSANASASVSDLLAARESVVSSEGGFVSVLSVSTNGAGSRKLVVREDGKPSTSYQLGNCIGRGQFGSVYRALNENTGQMVAVKRIRLEGLKEEEVMQLMREVDLVKSLSHPSVVKYEGMVREEGMLNIVLEYAENGSLGQTLKSFGKLNEALVARYVVKILEGLHYLHTSNIVHCDLKAANILTTKNGNVKLTDFGVSLNLRAMERERGSATVSGMSGVEGRCSSNQSGSGEPHGNVAGTPNWMAPEVIELKGASTKSDIWSLGCTVVELLTGKPPYADVGNAMSVMFRIVEDPMPPLPEKCDALLEDFLIKCFNKNPGLRPSAEELCEHPWLKKNWSAFKDLKAQDSIPWIRRVSADFQKPNDAIRYLSQLEITESPLSASPKDHHPLGLVGRQTSASSAVGRPSDGEFSPREHSFVKTTFSKPVTCRVCLLDVKKTALICGQCSLISHSKCAPNAPPTCDLRAQLLRFAQYAEKGNPASVYSNPAAAMNHTKQNVALSDVAFVEHSRTSLDGSPQPVAAAEHPQQQMPPPPGAFKFMAAFKRSRSNLTPEPTANDEDGNGHAKMHRLIKRSFGALHPSSPSSLPSSSPPPPPPPLPHLPASAPAITSESLASCNSSLRSAATANESFSSRQNTCRLSQVSTPVSGGSGSGRGEMQRRKSNPTVVVLETVPASRPRTSGVRSEEVECEEDESVIDVDVDDTRVPGGFEPKKRKKGGSPGCMVQ